VTSILSAISGQFTKSLILGMFFPALMFILAAVAAIGSYASVPTPFVNSIAALDKEWRVLVISFLTVFVSGLLYNLNVSILRLYEGYPWMKSFLGRLLQSHHERRFLELAESVPKLRLLRDSLKQIDSKRSDRAAFLSQTLDRRLKVGYPRGKDLVLPTLFGNTIRSFETYPSAQYGLSAIAFWPRLVAIADKDYLAAVDEAKISVDFFTNASFLSYLLFVILVISGAAITINGRFDTVLWWPWEALISLIAGWLFYRGAIGSAAAWGETVKGAFDLYRSALLKKLGYEAEFSTREEERKFWLAVTQQVVYGDPPPPASPLFYKTEKTVEPSPRLIVEPAAVKLTLLRGCQQANNGSLNFSIKVSNRTAQDAASVQVVEALPPELLMEWNSARLNQAPLQNLSGSVPITFDLGPLPAGQEKVVTYSAINWKPQ